MEAAYRRTPWLSGSYHPRLMDGLAERLEARVDTARAIILYRHWTLHLLLFIGIPYNL